MIVIILIVVMTAILFLTKDNTGFKARPKECKPHSWVMKFEPDHKGYLICKKCGKIPGDD